MSSSYNSTVVLQRGHINVEREEQQLGKSEQTVSGKFEEMLPQFNGSSTWEGHLELGLALPAT